VAIKSCFFSLTRLKSLYSSFILRWQCKILIPFHLLRIP
jgi:hypothetical protein